MWRMQWHLNIEQLIKEIGELTVLELAQLVKES